LRVDLDIPLLESSFDPIGCSSYQVESPPSRCNCSIWVIQLKTQRKLATAIGALISEKRTMANMTQAELSEKLEIGSEAVSRFERGQVVPSVERIFQIADVLKCGVDELLVPASDRRTDQTKQVIDLLDSLDKKDLERAIQILKVLSN
jgi:transcriptional regulator with XRE-family HTH domain